MRRLSVLALLIVTLGACGRAAPPEGVASGTLCEDFIDATAVLRETSDYETYVSILNEAAAPVYDLLVANDRDVGAEVLASWERITHGNPTKDDMAAVDRVGGLLIPEFGPICEELGRNVGSVPPSAEWNSSEPPSVSIRPLYPEGTMDHACDVFIQTIFGWSEARSSGAEIGIHIAELTDGLIAELESFGVEDGIAELAIYSEKYRTLPMIRAHEEAESHLAAAGRLLADESVVCRHLTTFDPGGEGETVDVGYHRLRWEELGFDDYTVRIWVDDPDDPRGGQELLVVVRGGVVDDVYDIRTAQLIEPPESVPLTVEAMFDALDSNVPQHVSFHPVLGYPFGAENVHLFELAEGTDFDRSILGSTADPTATVEAVGDFTPGKACGAARVPGGEPIPDVVPLDSDANQALDALGAVEEEDGYFTSFDYGVFERNADSLVLLGEDSTGQLAYASFTREAGRWKVAHFGTCQWEDDGYGVSPWTLDPEVPFDPESSEIHLLVGDECGSHGRFGNEYLVVARSNGAAVELEVWRAEQPPISGENVFRTLECSLDQVVKLTVVLDEPIGDRELSGATDPADWPDDL